MNGPRWRSATTALLALLALAGSLDLHGLQVGAVRHGLAEQEAELVQASCEHAAARHLEPAARVPIRHCPACLQSLQARAVAAEVSTGLPGLVAEPDPLRPSSRELAPSSPRDATGCRGPPTLS